MVQKCPLLVNVHTIEHVNVGGYVVQKSQNLVNVNCVQPLLGMKQPEISHIRHWPKTK